MFLVQGSIFLKGPFTLVPSVTALSELLLRDRHHVIYSSILRIVLPAFIRTIQNKLDLPFPPPKGFRFRLPFSSFSSSYV